MAKILLTTPCLFGLESLLKNEIKQLGYDIESVEDGRITYRTDELGICRSNLWLRTAERVLVNMGAFEAKSFDALFENTKKIPWEKWIPKKGRFWVKKASSIKSQLFSASDIQSIVKKAIVERLKSVYSLSWFEESEEDYPIRVFIKKDQVSIGIDTTGDSLHRRGYRQLTSKAPLSETLAAALVQLTPWQKDRLLVDPLCGSGTIPIEAALIGLKIAPGLNRSFTAMQWTKSIPKKLWNNALEEANDIRDRHSKLTIQGYDIDDSILRAARENAKRAAVDEQIHFQQRSIQDFSSLKKYGFIITNPPYGERLEDKESVIKLYQDMGRAFLNLDSWSYFIITAFEDFERYFGKKSSKKRKLYNGMMKANLYQYYGPKPPRN